MAGIYLHIPFCKQACYYCDFHFSTSLKNKDQIVKAIQKELILRKNEIDETVETIYFGGGTPSLLSTEELNQILNTIETNFLLAENLEITIEANPDDLSMQKIEELSRTKINRLSIGIQSFFEEDLRFMNRAHSAQEAEDCLKFAKKYFKNITIDLIYGVPGMDSEKWLQNIQKALSFEIQHISCYALTVEEKTALAKFIEKGNYPAVDDALAQEHFKILCEILKAKGFVHYEISNFALPDFFSRHNSSYWQGKSYLGVGPSAHSYIAPKRSWNISNNFKYIKALERNEFLSDFEILSEKERKNEMIMIGLRTIWGISLVKFAEEFGIESTEVLRVNARSFLGQGKLLLEENHLKISESGKFYADGIASDLFFE